MASQKSKKTGKLFIISAPSGGGKTTITQEVIARLAGKYNIQRAINYTSRAPRDNEVNGIDYYFITQEEFLEKKAAGFFLETTRYDNNYYGSPISLIRDLAHGISFILTTDRPGAAVIKHRVPEAILIWIYVSNPHDIKQRLIQRSLTKSQNIERRFILAQQETEQELRENLFKYHIANDVLETAVQEVCNIIQEELNCDSSSR